MVGFGSALPGVQAGIQRITSRPCAASGSGLGPGRAELPAAVGMKLVMFSKGSGMLHTFKQESN